MSLKQDVTQYFDARLEAVPPIEFEAVAPRRRSHLPVFAAAAVLAVAVAGSWMLASSRTESRLASQLLASSHWQSETDVFITYSGRSVYRDLPTIGE